jgi:hypothetical protein
VRGVTAVDDLRGSHGDVDSNGDVDVVLLPLDADGNLDVLRLVVDDVLDALELRVRAARVETAIAVGRPDVARDELDPIRVLLNRRQARRS